MPKTTKTLTVYDEFAITPSDTLDVASDPNNTTNKYESVGLFLETAGTIKVTFEGGNTITKAWPAGYNPVSVVRVWATPAPPSGIYATITD